MKSHCLPGIFILIFICSSVGFSGELIPELSKQILEQFPRADRNGDGKLIGAEADFVQKQLVRKFPDADADGDGVLSTAEQTSFLKAPGGMTSSASVGVPTADSSPEEFARWMKKYPESDADGDGKLSIKEVEAYAKALKNPRVRPTGGSKKSFVPDPGWKADRFPEHAVCYLPPEEIRELYEGTFPDLPKSEEGVLRIVGTGHSFMAPGYQTLPLICEADGFSQPLFTHTGGGMTGSSRYKWEQENGIFGFDKKPTTKLLAAISNAEWDAMMWGPYFQDRPEYYRCWIEFCLKYNPEIKFYLSDAWIRLWELGATPPTDESRYTPEVIMELEAEKQASSKEFLAGLQEEFPDKIFVVPTSMAMSLAAVHQIKGELPGVESLHKSITGKERSLWRDPLGHIGPGFDRLEGYVFYSTLYKKSPELITEEIAFRGRRQEYPSADLDAIFRKIAWQAVTGNPLSGVVDEDGDGIGD